MPLCLRTPFERSNPMLNKKICRKCENYKPVYHHVYWKCLKIITFKSLSFWGCNILGFPNLPRIMSCSLSPSNPCLYQLEHILYNKKSTSLLQRLLIALETYVVSYNKNTYCENSSVYYRKK